MAKPDTYRPTNIPTEPGVYRFYNAHGEVIYVGKAKNLKNRLNSYFQKNLAPKTHRMVHEAVRVDWTIVGTEVEALQLEFTWIKKENPHYNIQFRDDKSYPYLAVSIDQEFPRLYISRNNKIKGVRFFGPYAHGWALRSTLEVLQGLFQLRTCTDSNFVRAQKTKRQCLLGDIGKCAAPCVGWVSPEENKDIARKLISFVDSNPEEIKIQIHKEMVEAAAKQEFEKAARLRDQLTALEKSEETAGTFLSNEFSADLIAHYEEITHVGITLFSVRFGRVIASRSWIIDRKDVLEEESLISAALSKIYSEWDVPSEILIDEQPNEDEIPVLEDWLKQRAGKSVKLHTPIRGDKFDLMQTVKRNAHETVVQYLSKRSNDAAVSGQALEEIATALGLDGIPLRIECFDISNIQGTSMVASMVVFEDGLPKKSQYRRFSIDDEQRFDDTRAMHHVITRRLKRYLTEKNEDREEGLELGAATSKFAYPPQLIVVDGGAPQVAAAAAALSELGIHDIALCGLAKRMEEVWLPGEKDPVIMPRHSEGLYLLQRVRDEAHRFAITYHRSKRSRLMLESLLDEIEGLGENRRKLLLENYGSVTALKKLELQEIENIPGIGVKLADNIYKKLHPEG
jgi:excinuclease ABC subunit C